MPLDEVIEDSRHTAKAPDNSSPAPEKHQAAEEMTAEIKAWADAASSQPHSLGGIICRARNTAAGELIGIAALGTKHMQFQMLTKLFEQLDRKVIAQAIAYHRMSPLERIFVDVLLEARDEVVTKGSDMSDESLKKAVEKSFGEDEKKPETEEARCPAGHTLAEHLEAGGCPATKRNVDEPAPPE
jgi:predicted lipid-binding transport protein (Tim44 family)